MGKLWGGWGKVEMGGKSGQNGMYFDRYRMVQNGSEWHNIIEYRIRTEWFGTECVQNWYRMSTELVQNFQQYTTSRAVDCFFKKNICFDEQKFSRTEF
jgi:hypothetical protein